MFWAEVSTLASRLYNFGPCVDPLPLMLTIILFIYLKMYMLLIK